MKGTNVSLWNLFIELHKILFSLAFWDFFLLLPYKNSFFYLYKFTAKFIRKAQKISLESHLLVVIFVFYPPPQYTTILSIRALKKVIYLDQVLWFFFGVSFSQRFPFYIYAVARIFFYVQNKSLFICLVFVWCGAHAKRQFLGMFIKSDLSFLFHPIFSTCV